MKTIMNRHVYGTAQDVAEQAARQTITLLKEAVEKRGHASWLLAGGSTPNLAYKVIADSYLDALDWSKVTVALGDERIGPLDGPDNNWRVIQEILLQHLPAGTLLRPDSRLSVVEAAKQYEDQLAANLASPPYFDIAWLGMGPDGHTLSLFPGHKDFHPSDTRIVTPITHSPKPPSERISLTLRGLQSCQAIFILATGESKRAAIENALHRSSNLPIALAAKISDKTTWMLDSAAS